MKALIIDGKSHGEVAVEYLAERLAELPDRCEVWLEENGGPSLCLLKSGSRALLMFLRSPEDAGLTSRASDSPKRQSLSFTLSNGQVDEYDIAWTVPFAVGKRAMEYAWFEGSPAEFVRWHDDAAS